MIIASDRLRNFSPDQRKQLAASMVSPMRCGGCTYDESGRRLYMHGGKLFLEDSPEYRNLRRLHGYL